MRNASKHDCTMFKKMQFNGFVTYLQKFIPFAAAV